MVMRPEPWGEALDALERRRRHAGRPDPGGTAVHPGGRPRPRDANAAGLRLRPLRGHRPAGRRPRPRPDRGARALARATTSSTAARSPRWPVIEAVVRLLPGFMGNAESLAEESHEDGLLEYPVYTKPAILARPRRARRCCSAATTPRSPPGATSRRYAGRRRCDPTWSTPAVVADDEELRPATPADAGELLTLQRACWVQEQQANPDVEIPALHESLDDVRAWLGEWTVLVLRRAGRWSAPPGHGRARDGRWDIGRLMVAPDLQGRGSRPPAARAQSRRPRRRGDGVRAVHRRPQRPATCGCTSKAGYRLRRDRPRRRPGAVPCWPSSGLIDRRRARISGRGARALADSPLGPVGRRVASAHVSAGVPRRAPATGGADAAGHRLDRPHRTTHIRG